MKVNQWTLGLAAAGVISFGAVAQAEEKPSNQVLTAVSSTQISGYVSTSAHWNPSGQAGFAGTGPSYLNNKGDGFNMDLVQLTIQKPLDEGEWSAGYVAELWMGPDATTLGNTLGTGAGTTSAGSISLAQGYIALNVPVGNGLVLKVGTFNTVIGYEGNNSPDNPNYSRSWGYTLGPFQHEGIVATYKVCDGFSVTAGVANRQDTGLQSVAARAGGGVPAPPIFAPVAGAGAGTTVQSQKTYMAAISLTAPDSWGFLKGAVLNAGIVDGISAALGSSGALPDVTNIHIGATIPTPIESIKLGFAWDHVQADGNALTGRIQDTDAFAFYTSFSNLGIEKLKLNTRLEYVTIGNVSALGGSFLTADPNIVTATATLDYQLWANVISRMEYRWDHDATGNNSGPGQVRSGVVGGGANNAHLIALNLIYKF